MRTPPDSANPFASGASARYAGTAVSVAVVTASGRGAGLEGDDVLGRERLAPQRPVPALDLLDDHPRDAAHVLTLDLDHRVGELLDHLLLLVLIEDALDELDVDERHVTSPLQRLLVGRPTKHSGRLRGMSSGTS